MSNSHKEDIQKKKPNLTKSSCFNLVSVKYCAFIYNTKVHIFFVVSTVSQSILKRPESTYFVLKNNLNNFSKILFQLKIVKHFLKILKTENCFYLPKKTELFSRKISRPYRFLFPLYLFLKFSWILNNARDIELCNLGEHETMHKL